MPEGEREEIRQVYAAKGFCGDDLERIVEVITSDRQVWLDTMMREELGYGSDVTNPLRAATSTLVAFIAIGFLPLGAFVYDLVMPGDVAAPFAWSAVLTGLAFLIVGALKARFVDQAGVAVGAGDPRGRRRRRGARLRPGRGAARRGVIKGGADARSGRRSSRRRSWALIAPRSWRCS